MSNMSDDNTEVTNPESGKNKLFWLIMALLVVTIGLTFFVARSLGIDRIASFNGRTNILIMGKSGESHAGPDLTDTMVLVSVSLNSAGITTISIPRDLWIPEIRAKINSAYYWGDKMTPYFDNSKNTKIGFAKTIAAEVVGQPIQYGAVIDFSAFKDIIDALGGVQVNVERNFTDNLYPIAGRENDDCGGDPTFACRYQAVTFTAGMQMMNGETALEFVRSRHAEGEEGTDIAREARQQKVIDAIKNKITNPLIFLSPKVDLAMLNVLKKYVETDIDARSVLVIGRKAFEGRGSVKQLLIPEELLFNPPISKTYDFQYIFIPKAGNGKWQEINNWVTTILH